jgi:hypothetical protein
MAADKTELRGLAPLDLVQALDALAHSEGKDRNTYVNGVLDLHVKKKTHAAIILTRMLRGNAYLSDASPEVTE